MKVFSFCLYGDKPKYIRGMHENIKIITEKFPEWKIFIYHDGTDIMNQYKKYSNVVLHRGMYNGRKLMLDRFCAIDEPDVEIMMVRDADSRINERDEWCIREFIKSDKLFHIIHDHPYHNTSIMGGLWGIKKECMPHYKFRRAIDLHQMAKDDDEPNLDQEFLGQWIYVKVYSKALYHGQLPSWYKDHSLPIPFKHEHMFCGQVIEYDSEGREYHNCDDCRAIQLNEDSY